MKTYWETFDGFYQMGPQVHRVFLLNKLRELKVQSFLDVGCGTGPLYEMIEMNPDKWVFDYKGIDYSRSMIKVCKKNFKDGKFEVGDARRLSEKSNNFDAVVLMHSLDHLDDYKSAIKEATRVAKKYVVIILWRSLIKEGTHLNSVNTMNRDDGKSWDDTHLQEYSREALMKEFDKNKLKVVFETDGYEINENGRSNYMFILKK